MHQLLSLAEDILHGNSMQHQKNLEKVKLIKVYLIHTAQKCCNISVLLFIFLLSIRNLVWVCLPVSLQCHHPPHEFPGQISDNSMALFANLCIFIYPIKVVKGLSLANKVTNKEKTNSTAYKKTTADNLPGGQISSAWAKRNGRCATKSNEQSTQQNISHGVTWRTERVLGVVRFASQPVL